MQLHMVTHVGVLLVMGSNSSHAICCVHVVHLQSH